MITNRILTLLLFGVAMLAIGGYAAVTASRHLPSTTAMPWVP